MWLRGPKRLTVLSVNDLCREIIHVVPVRFIIGQVMMEDQTCFLWL